MTQTTPGTQIIRALLAKPEQRRFDIALDRKQILSYPTVEQTAPVVVPGPTIAPRLRSLIPATKITGDGVLYLRETSITNSPIVPVSPGALKPQMDLTYEVQRAPVTTIPAYIKLPAQYWDDFDVLQSWIDSRLLYSLALAEEKQLLNGNGTPPQLAGLMTVALAVPAAGGTPAPGASAMLANVAAGIQWVYAHGYMVDGIVLNPGDWGFAVTAGTVGGIYLGLSPVKTLWGYPVILSPAMPSGSYLVGQFNPYSQIFDRETVAVEVATQNQDDFVRNLITVRGEERLAFAVYQPAAFGKGTFALA